MRGIPWSCLVLLVSGFQADPQGVITTIAGTDFVFEGDGKKATDVPLGPVFGVAVSPAGEIFIASSTQNLVLKVRADGTIKTVAGNGIRGFSGEGTPAVNASLNFPLGLAVSAAGDVYVADQENQSVRRISPQGTIFRFAGDPFEFELGDQGPANAAALSYPASVAVDTRGNLYIADPGHHRIRLVTPDGNISTVAGTGNGSFSGDMGPAISASLNNPQGVAVDATGNLYIADSGNNRIRRVSADGKIVTIAGNGNTDFSGDGDSALNASLNGPYGVAVDSSRNVYIADSGHNRLRRVDASGIIQTIAGGDIGAFAGDNGPARNALLNQITSVAVDPAGNIFIADFLNYRVRKITPDGKIATIAGNGQARFSGDGGPATLASLDDPQGVSADAAGNLYIADTVNHRIRKLGADGVITTIAGNGTAGFCGDSGNAVSACLNLPVGSIPSDANGNLYFADSKNNRVRRISAAGAITTIAGGGQAGLGDGGPAVNASLNSPVDVDVDSSGNVYIADRGNHRVRLVTPDGTISTFAGNGQADFSGDGGPAANASLHSPSGVTVDTSGNVYLADKDNRRVRRVTAGTINTIAGNGVADFSGDGDALNSSINGPLKVVLDGAGNLYVVDYFNQRIRRISPDGVLTTVVGNGRADYTGDGGAPASASLNGPTSLAINASGNLFVADSGNNRIRAVLTSPPAFSISTDTVSVSAKAGGAPSSAANVQLSSQIPGLAYSVDVTTSTGGTWLLVSASPSSIPAILAISGDPGALSAGQYTGTVKISAPAANPPVKTITVTLTVTDADAPGLSVQPSTLAFALNQGGSAQTQLLRVASLGIGSISYSVLAATTTGGSWLSAGSQTGFSTPRSVSATPIMADPRSLAPGAYNGKVTIIPADGSARIETPVVLTVRPPRASLKLTQSGLLFTGVAGGGIGPPQSFGIANTGSGSMNWRVGTKTLSGGTNWLSVDVSTGSSIAGVAVPGVNVSADPSGLSSGAYFGQVTITADGADNSPQSLTVVLNVLPQDANPGALLDRTGLVFTGVSGGSSSGSQDARVFDITADPGSFGTSTGTDDGTNWLTVVPKTATFAPNAPKRVTVQPDITGVGRGAHFGTVTLTFKDGTYRVITVLLVMLPKPASGSQRQRENTAACMPTQLLPVFTSAPNQVNVPIAYPSALSVSVIDDCGQPLSTGSVVASFSNGDVQLPLYPLGDGGWSGTWTPKASRAPIITITAQNPLLGLRGTTTTAAALTANTDTPVINPDGIVNTVSQSSLVPLTPGGLISILGSRLANGQNMSPNNAWQTTLAGTSVLLAGQLLPLQFANDGQINAIVPFDIPVNTLQSLLLQRGSQLATAQDISAATAQPTIFAKSAGGSQGQIFVADAQGGLLLADTNNPATAGDTVVIRCAGLGPVNPNVPAGVSAPPTPPSATVNPVSLSIGGKDAMILFAGLVPGEIGVYQIRAKVPDGISPAPGVPVTIVVAGQSNPAATMAIR